MKGNDEVVQVLQDVLCAELTAINQYFIHARMNENWGYKKLAAYIQKESIEEMRHAQHLIDRILYFDMPPVAVSSTEVRERVARGEPIDDLVPPAVAAEIARLGLYASPDYTDRKTERTRDRP